MIQYHGSPLSGKDSEKVSFYTGRHALISFISQRDLGLIAETASSFVFDNGAFSIWRKGGELDVCGYYKWCDHWHRHPGFKWAIIPDVIDGNENENDSMIDSWPSHIKGIPVYHLHESLKRAQMLVEKFDIVAIGSSGKWPTPGTISWWKRMSEIMAVFTDSKGRPRTKLHGLRMLNPKVFTKIPLHSADSANAAINAGSIKRFGMYVPPKSSQRAAIIAERIGQYNSSPIWKGSE